MFPSGGILSMRIGVAPALSAVIAIPALPQHPPRGGMRGMGGGGMLMLLGNKSVQEELKITDEQKTKITEFATKANEGRPRFDPNGDMDEFRKTMSEFVKKQTEATEKFSKETLTEEQQKRIKQISIQQAGLLPGMMGMGGPSEDTLKTLKVTDEQKNTFKEIGEQLNKDRRELFQGGGGFGNPETMRKAQALQKEASEKALAALTDEQKKSWTELTGKPFEVKFEQGAGFGGKNKKKKDKDKDN